MKSDLIDRFTGFSQENKLFQPDDLVIVAVSGGGDSLALVDLFSRINQRIILAHCNFQLRGEESDQDEEFVRKIALVYDLPLRVTTFDTAAWAENNGISIEMAARELRYQWFEEIRKETSSSAIAVAHHLDDSIETMLINLIRGTGIRGLSGIQPRNGQIIRPLLFTNRKEITNYLDYRHLEYRLDSSNLDINFVRNRIRQVILPEIEKINPSVRQVFQEEQEFLSQAQGIVKLYTESAIRNLVREDEGQLRISIPGLKADPFAAAVLFGILRPYGYHGRQIKKILAAAGKYSGKVFRSRNHELLIDREEILVGVAAEKQSDRYYFDPESPEDGLPIPLECRIIHDVLYKPVRDPSVACLDLEKLDMPLILRKWEKGDYFYPLGMNHSKKVSDFFIDQKINLLNKDRQWILASGEQIVWIVGLRIDNRFRVTGETQDILEIRIL